jgi:hypothetical protein
MIRARRKNSIYEKNLYPVDDDIRIPQCPDLSASSAALRENDFPWIIDIMEEIIGILSLAASRRKKGYHD